MNTEVGGGGRHVVVGGVFRERGGRCQYRVFWVAVRRRPTPCRSDRVPADVRPFQADRRPVAGLPGELSRAARAIMPDAAPLDWVDAATPSRSRSTPLTTMCPPPPREPPECSSSAAREQRASRPAPEKDIGPSDEMKNPTPHAGKSGKKTRGENSIGGPRCFPAQGRKAVDGQRDGRVRVERSEAREA